MIISCENCDTKYRLDASRLSHASVKVQCSKCDHIFIVPAAGEERKKQGLEVSPPHEDKQTESSVQPPAENEPQQTEADDTAVPHEHEEQSSEEDKTGHSGDTAGASAADFSFPAEAETPEPTQDETTEPRIEAEAEKDAPEHEAKTGTEQPEETGPQEVSEGSTEAAGPIDEANKEAPLPWEVNANTFDLSFGAEEHKAQSEAEADNAEEETAEEKSSETPDDLNGAHEATAAPEATEPLDDEEEIKKEEEKDIEAPLESGEKDFDIQDLIEEADESHAPSNEVSEEALSFTEELLKAASDDDKTPGATAPEAPDKTETETEDSAQQNNTFVIPADTSSEPEPQEAKKSGLGGIITIFVIVIAIAGGLIYMKSRPDSVLMNEPSLAKSIEIESTKGYYVVNKEGGRIFVIETLLKNVTDGPVKISGIRGLVMDSSGREMARKMVSPGRIVTAKDLRNLPIETLLKSFSDTSEGTMPKKSTIPTMILFTNLQKAVAEYGIDVLR